MMLTPLLTPRSASPSAEAGTGGDGADSGRAQGTSGPTTLTVGVLALQGGFSEHLDMLSAAELAISKTRASFSSLPPTSATCGTTVKWQFIPVRTVAELGRCDGLIIPGGESSAIGILANEEGLLDPLRRFVNDDKRPVWGTCAGSILLCNEIMSPSSTSASSSEYGTSKLNVDVQHFRISGLCARAYRNHFGRQINSSVRSIHVWLPRDSRISGDIPLGNMTPTAEEEPASIEFQGIFIRAPVLEVLEGHSSIQNQGSEANTILAGKNQTASSRQSETVQILARLEEDDQDIGRPVALRQGNILATCFHPELGEDTRLHQWWLRCVREAYAL